MGNGMCFLPNSGTRRELSIDTSCNRGCPHKQNNPVLGQQQQLEEESPVGCWAREAAQLPLNTPSHSHSSTKGGGEGCRDGAKRAHGGPLDMELALASGLTTGSAKPWLLTQPCEVDRTITPFDRRGNQGWPETTGPVAGPAGAPGPGWPTALLSERHSSPH